MKKITNVILPLALVLTLCIALLPANKIQAAEDPSQANTGSGMSVSGISLKNMYRGIEISWNAVSGADGYNIYRKGPYDTEWTRAGNTNDTEYLDTFPRSRNNQTFEYKVGLAAPDGKNIRGSFSPVKIIISLSRPPLQAFKVSNVKSGIKLAVDTFSSNKSGFIVYRRGPGESAYTRIAKVKRTGSRTVYTDADVMDMGRYSYKICYYKSSSKSAVSKERTCMRIGAVSLKMKQTEENVKLSWNEYPNASGYQIYRGVDGSGYVFYKETTEKEFTESMKDAYIYDDIETDYVGKRCYKVRPYYNDGVSIWYGAFSSSKMVN